MKVIQFYGPRNLKFEDVEKPLLSPGEVLVEIKAALTGGTDVKTYLNGHPRIIKSIPSSFGYEFAGTIVAIGDDSPEGFAVGDDIVTANTAPCYECFFCKKEEYSLCEDLEFLNGSFAEFIKIPARIVKHNLYKIPEGLSFKEAAMVQTLAVCLHGFERSDIKDGDTLTIYGLGPIGQCFIKLAKAIRKDLKVIAIGKSEFKRKLAFENGADHVLDRSSDKFEEDYKKFAGYGADTVIEAVGKPEAWKKSFDLVRKGGLINFFGGCPKGSEIELDTYKLHYDEIRTMGVFHHSPKYMQAALELLAKKTIDLNNLVTHEMKLEELEAALQLMMDGKALKILIRHQA